MSDEHFPYRRYQRYPLARRRRYRWRLHHDGWCWGLGLGWLAFFLALAWMNK